MNYLYSTTKKKLLMLACRSSLLEGEMKLFTWYKRYSVNNDELDDHHKALFDILNRLYENCMEDRKINCLEPIVEELVAYSNYHFSAEEQYMRGLGYKEIDRQVAEHRAFRERALQLKQVADKDDSELTKELIVFLGNWLLHHVMEEDKKFAV
jgi:hemerythrin-like metal-binding protein